MEKYAVIMAGGSGSRLWPLSRESKPKQFISIGNSQCMIQKTISRVNEVVPLENIFVITNKILSEITEKVLIDLLPASNIILEPSRKNTAACILYASLLMKQKFGDGLLCFVPADGFVKSLAGYRTALEQAYNAAQRTNHLVVIGITPTYPATGYGYIHIDKSTEADVASRPVDQFTEKPDPETAEKLVSSGEFLWNSGILAGSIDAILENTSRFLPEHYLKISAAVQTDGQKAGAATEKAYEEISDVSFDIGVLEKSHAISAVIGNFDWDDIGNLDSLSKIFPTDEDGNQIEGNYCGLDTKNSVVYSDGALVSAIGVDNMIIASTKDAVLVCPRQRVQEIKALVDKLKANGFETLT